MSVLDAIISTGKIAGAITAVGGVIFLMIKGIRTIYGAAKNIEDSFKILKDQSEELKQQSKALQVMDDRVTALDYQFKAQFTPNGGSSVIDALHRMEDRLGIIQQEKAIALIASGIAEFVTDIAGDCVYVNRIYCELLGITPEEAIGAGWSNFLHEDDRARVFSSWAEAVGRGTEWHFPRYRFVRKDGEVVWCKGSAYPHRKNGREVRGYVGFVQVIEGGTSNEQSEQN